MYEKINGKFYKLIDENQIRQTCSQLSAKINSLKNGIATCEKSIEAFTQQKTKYLEELSNIFELNDIDEDMLKLFEDEKKSNGI